jgi:hypothetical protein
MARALGKPSGERIQLAVTRFSRCRGLASSSDASSVVDCVKQDRCQRPAAIGRHEHSANEPERQTRRRPGNTAGPPRRVEGPPWLRIDHSQAWASHWLCTSGSIRSDSGRVARVGLGCRSLVGCVKGATHHCSSSHFCAILIPVCGCTRLVTTGCVIPALGFFFRNRQCPDISATGAAPPAPPGWFKWEHCGSCELVLGLGVSDLANRPRGRRCDGAVVVSRPREPQLHCAWNLGST